MQVLFFFIFWTVFSLGTVTIVAVWFSTYDYSLVSIAVVIGFAGGALLSALITGLFEDDQWPQSK